MKHNLSPRYKIEHIKPKWRKYLNRGMNLPTFDLKTRRITFDDRLRQIRIIENNGSPANNGYMGGMDFIPYDSEKGDTYLMKYFGDNAWRRLDRA